jgi:hypothetical protein
MKERIQDLPDATYHAHPAIGASTAKLAHTSIRLYRDALDGVFEREDKGHLAVGRIAHMAILEPDRFRQQVVTTGPTNPKTGKEYGRDTNAWKDWEAANPGVIVVDPWIPLAIQRCPSEIRNRLASGASEESWFVRHSGLEMKARPDKVFGPIISDLKTIDRIEDARRAIFRNSYWFSDAWYRMVGKLLTGDRFTYDFIFVEKSPPHRWRIVTLSDQYAAWADRVVDDTVGKILRAMTTGDWEDDGPIHDEVPIPEFLVPQDVHAAADGSINVGDDD